MDDLTKETISEALGLPMELNESVETDLSKFFASIHSDMTNNNLRQAYFPVEVNYCLTQMVLHLDV